MLLNQPRAREIMKRENFDALLAMLPINVYYLSDYWGLFNTPVGYDAAYMALFPREEVLDSALIIPALELRRTRTKGTWMPELYAFSTEEKRIFDNKGVAKGMNYSGWRSREGANLSELEKSWVEIVDLHGGDVAANAFWAMTRAIKTAGLESGRVVTDDPRLSEWLKECGLKDIKCEYRADIFNEIRLVKTPDEIALMRTAAIINENALLAATDALQVGASWKEIENIYMQSIAEQGGRGIYLMCGVGELPHRKVRLGEPIMLDALGQFEHYHGDFGRCAILGEPTKEHYDRHAAICFGWKEAQNYLKPGTCYSEISMAVGQAIRDAGFIGFRDPIVHSLGLEHTDDPKMPGVQPQEKPNQNLVEGMVVNVDMPFTELGWGSVHMEDTVLITSEGCERLGNSNFDLIVIEPK
ncbi:MAG: Xaa-Pro peptidase family protein [Pseudomonadota bacterium]|nr:Xaa-Pro peptidase family protein [Pseudomonadota bacterium]